MFAIHNFSEEKRALFEYVSDKEISDIQACYDHPKQAQFVSWIRSETVQGWTTLIHEYESDLTFPMHTVLKAAYCQDKLNVEELATAYIFLAPAASKHRYTIHHMDEGQFRFFWKIRDSIPRNQQFFVEIDTEDLSQEGQDFMDVLFNPVLHNNVAGGICLDRNPHSVKKMAMGSAALIKNDPRAEGHPPIFIRGLSTRERMYEHLEKGLSDIALLDPAEIDKIIIHNARAESLLPYAHDGFHTALRVYYGILKRPDVLNFGKKIEHVLTKMPDFSKEAIISRKSVSVLLEYQTFHDVARFVLDELSGYILDGEALCNKDRNEVIARGLTRKFEKVADLIFRQEEYNQILPILNEALKELNVKVRRTDRILIVEQCHL